MKAGLVGIMCTLVLGIAACGGGGGNGTEPPNPVLTSVTVSPSTFSIDVGVTQQLSATGRDQNNNPMSGLPAASWESSNEARATVNTSGLVTGQEAGTVTITATITHDGTTRSGNSAGTIVDPAPLPPAEDVDATISSTFDPSTVQIATDGTVTWHFAAGIVHNVTFAATAGAPSNIGDSTDESVPRTFNAAGDFNYQCTLHPGMSGRVEVRNP